MSISLKTHKLLWSASGRLCARCKINVVEAATLTDDHSIVGEEAHIVSKLENGPRYDDLLPIEERDEFENLLILCSRCHKIVDDQVNTYTVEVLRKMKLNHERDTTTVSPLGRTSESPKAIQSSKVSSCYYPLRFPINPEDNEAAPEMLVKLLPYLSESLWRCFAHTCVSIGAEDFVFLLTLDRAEVQSDSDHVAYDLEVHCHFTEFVRTLQARLDSLLKGEGSHLTLNTLPGSQVLEQKLRFGNHVPHRIHRAPPNGIVIRAIDGITSAPGKRTNTSGLLSILGKIFGGVKILIWDEIETYPDALKVMKMIDWIADHGFSWSELFLDPSNPESWEYTTGDVS